MSYDAVVVPPAALTLVHDRWGRAARVLTAQLADLTESRLARYTATGVRYAAVLPRTEPLTHPIARAMLLLALLLAAVGRADPCRAF